MPAHRASPSLARGHEALRRGAGRPWVPPAAGAAVVLALLACLFTAACGGRGTALEEVVVEPAAISPNADGAADVARIGYKVNRPLHLTVTLEQGGRTWPLRDDLYRAADRYEALFGGIVEGHMIPDGAYTVRFTATPDDGGAPVVIEAPLTVSGGDVTAPGISGFAVEPEDLSPNQDGFGDEVSVAYELDGPADVRVFLAQPDGTFVADLLEEEESATNAGEPGPHVYRYDAGVEADAKPPPNGEYRVVVEARDAVGNVTREEQPLRIRDGGQPRESFLGDVEWSATTLPLGGTLVFTTTVRNDGDTPIRTRGPEPGYVYDNRATFNAVPVPGFIVLARTDAGGRSAFVPAETVSHTVSLDFGRPQPARGPVPLEGTLVDATARDDATPAAATVCGRVVTGEQPVAGATVAAFEADGDGLARTTTDDAGGFCFPDLPVPAAHERSFARSPGALRVGLEYNDHLTDVDYPYRWQLGRTEDLDVCESGGKIYLCLMPGKEVAVTGGVTFMEPPLRRTTDAYLALMHEDVRRIGPYDPQRVTIEH